MSLLHDSLNVNVASPGQRGKETRLQDLVESAVGQVDQPNGSYSIFVCSIKEFIAFYVRIPFHKAHTLIFSMENLAGAKNNKRLKSSLFSPHNNLGQTFPDLL